MSDLFVAWILKDCASKIAETKLCEYSLFEYFHLESIGFSGDTRECDEFATKIKTGEENRSQISLYDLDAGELMKKKQNKILINRSRVSE